MTHSIMVDFFSLIPEDIHHAIVSRLFLDVGYKYFEGNVYVAHKRHLQALLEYAKLTPLSHRLVIDAMKFKFAPWYCPTISMNWITHFADDLQEIDLSCTTIQKCRRPFPKLSKLRKARIRSTFHQIKLIRNAPSLEHLSIEFGLTCDWKELGSILKRLPLKHFLMWFHPYFTKKLHMVQVECLTELKDSCTLVEHLTLSGEVRLTKRVYDMISGFKSLKKLSLEATIRPKDLPHLKAYSNLEFINLSSKSLSVVVNLGRRVKELSCCEQNRDDIEALSALQDLKVLKIQPSCTVENATKALRTVVGNLDALSIQFPYTFSSKKGIFFPNYKKLEGHAFAQLLEEAKSIKFLCIENLSFDSEAMESILQVVGDKLKELHVCIDWQSQPAALRIENVLNSAAKHCPNLKVLRLLERRFDSGPIIISTREQRESCIRSLSNLKDNSPHFSSFVELHSFILARFRRAPKRKRGKQWDVVLPHVL